MTCILINTAVRTSNLAMVNFPTVPKHKTEGTELMLFEVYLINKWKGNDHNQSWPNMRYYNSIILLGLRKTMKNLS
jgi:hypothetical protein